MRQRQLAYLSCIVFVGSLLVASCGPEETPGQRLERLRYNHEIFPVGTTTLYNEGGEPSLFVDMQVANQGGEPLSKLTVLVRVRGADGVERAERRVTLDLGDLRPGVGMQIGGSVPGIALEEGDQVTVEIEQNLTDEELRSLPEFADVAGVS